MRVQEPSVLVRIPGTTRDRLDQLRQKTKYSWGGEGPPESLGQVITRLTTAGVNRKAIAAKPLKVATRVVNKPRRRKTRAGRRHR